MSVQTVHQLIPNPQTVAKWRRYKLTKSGTGAGSFFLVNGVSPQLCENDASQDVILFIKPPHGIIQSGDRGLQIENQSLVTGVDTATIPSLGLGAINNSFTTNPDYDLKAALGPTNFAVFDVSLANRLTDNAEAVTATVTITGAGKTVRDIAGLEVDFFVRWSQVDHDEVG